MAFYRNMLYNREKSKEEIGMIQAIYGKKGSGKTKRLLDMANDALKVEHGDMVFIDDDKRYMYDLRHEVRFVDASEYSVKSADMFLGFIYGMLSQNFDVTAIFIDAFMKLVKTDISELGDFFAQLEAMSDKRGVRFVISVSGDPDVMPEFMRKYVI